MPNCPIDPAGLTTELIRCASVTPVEGGALIILERILSDAGFACTRVDRGDVSNLYARWGDKTAAKTFGFNGHTDVVPIGAETDWTFPPFSAAKKDGMLWGRGATDMKSGVAAFTAAAIDLVRQTPPEEASIVISITGDEEGDAIDGTSAILDWMNANNEHMDVCLVGEPTCPETLGDMIKIGRRGSLSVWFTIKGVQGHAAYPHRAKNPLPPMARLMDRLASKELDKGTDHFDPSTLAVVNIDTGNPTTNVIPAQTRSIVNIRFNDTHHSSELINWMQGELDQICEEFEVEGKMQVKVSGESFLTPPGELSALVSKAVEAETGITPVLSTTGGTSDARFIKAHCPVVEFGLVGQTMHQVDERVEIVQIHQLKSIYLRILRDYFE